jgi:ribonuclease HII
MSRAHSRSAAEVARELREASDEELPGLIDASGDDPRKQVAQAVASARRRLERHDAERRRVEAMYELQRELGGDGLVMGIDEVGRGAIAGPLTVCSVVLPQEPRIWGINDSKQLRPQVREELAERIRASASAIGIAHVPPAEIDRIGMGSALRLAMSRAIEDAGVEPDAVLIDGNPVHVHPRERCIVKGDARVACIACASIVAKVTRDAMMVAYAADYPGYHLDECKGYASSDHIAAIREHGLTPLHRKSFCGNFVEGPTLF